MEKRILETLERIEWERDVEILYACESGSRAWGFASPDSDYDVRFIYAGNLDRYLTVERVRDVIELPIVDELDVNGWDVKKALGLMRSSNPTLLEWLHSPVVYRANERFVASMRTLAAEAMRPRTLCHHYLSMAWKDWRNNIERGRATPKRYLYTLRTLLCARWVIEHGAIPPVAFDELIKATVDSEPLWNEINELLLLKANSNEKARMLRNPVFDRYIAEAFAELEARLPDSNAKLPPEPFNELLVKTVGV
ncbi:MAG: nucleotidyltransferase domain-containing protein [Marinobacter sp.]|nr:nucleotidyltransferase domain-containing protein [Marinobacter sp.]